jgi:hypothetical protein
MRSLFALLAIALSSVGASACGGTRGSLGVASRASSSVAVTASGPTQTRPGLPTDGDGDNDSPSNSRYDGDDSAVLYFGHAVSAAEARAITGLVEHYYAAAAVNDGATACSMIYSIIAESVVEDYGQSSGPSAVSGKTCATVVSKLFNQHHRELVSKAAALKVTRVRVEGDRGVVLLRFGATSERRILVHYERGTWKMDDLLDIGVP